MKQIKAIRRGLNRRSKMSYLTEYTLAMDYVREKFGLPASVSMYEAVVKTVIELKRLEAELQKSQKEKSWAKKTKKIQSKSKK
jgi:hypothetical protein